MDEKLKAIKPKYDKYRYKSDEGYHVHIGKFTLLITKDDPESLMIFREGVGRMEVHAHTRGGCGPSTFTEHSGCPVVVDLATLPEDLEREQ